MSHECPECYQVCYCNGDIDDCILNIDEDVNRCIHCPIDGEDEEYYDESDEQSGP